VSSLQEDVRNLLKLLYSMSPAYNSVVQALFILPQRARVLMGMYPELMEKEEELMELFSLRYSEKGFMEASHGGLGHHLASLYRRLFGILANAKTRSLLLSLANISEEEFKELDPLRAWMEVSLKYLAEVNKDALKLLDIVVTKLSDKESVHLDEIRQAASDIKNFDALMRILDNFFLLPYEGSSWVYQRGCSLLLDVYSDLRSRLKEMLR